MIFGNIEQLSDFEFLDEKIKTCLTYVKEHELLTMEPGRYELDGNRLYMNLEEFTTISAEGRDYEAHKRYLDIFYIVDGTERVDLNFIENMEQIGYDEEKDRMSLKGERAGSIVLQTGDFLICYPHDAHQPAIFVKEAQKIKKAVFKVMI